MLKSNREVIKEQGRPDPKPTKSITGPKPHQLPDLCFDLVHLRKRSRACLEKTFLRLRKTSNDPVSPGARPPAVARRNRAADSRQTGGSGKIPSGGAVLDPHYRFLSRRRFVGPIFGHLSPPFVVLPRGRLSQCREVRTWCECRMEGAPARPRLPRLLARRVPRETGRLHPEMGHASWGSRGALPRA